MLKFKNNSLRLSSEWFHGQYPPLLREVVMFYAELRGRVLDEDTVITAGWSTLQEDVLLGRRSRTHAEWRAIDTRIDLDREDLEEAIRIVVNRRYPTGLSAMPRIAPLRHGTAPHAHIQITRSEAGM